MRTDVFWSLLFSTAIAILMLAILLVRTEPVEQWVLIVYPLVGALLAHVASRTSPTIEEIAWIETSTIAAACIVVLAALVNLLLIELLLNEILSGAMLTGNAIQQFAFFALPTIAALLWWALERRLTRMRRAGLKALKAATVKKTAAPEPVTPDQSRSAEKADTERAA